VISTRLWKKPCKRALFRNFIATELAHGVCQSLEILLYGVKKFQEVLYLKLHCNPNKKIPVGATVAPNRIFFIKSP